MPAESRALRGPALCVLGRIMAALDEEDQRDLDFMLDHPEKYSTRVLAKTLTETGYPVKKDAVNSHRRALCNCPTKEM